MGARVNGEAARLRIGCSGWNCQSWSGRFYPTGPNRRGGPEV